MRLAVSGSVVNGDAQSGDDAERSEPVAAEPDRNLAAWFEGANNDVRGSPRRRKKRFS
jgi:hypothetical protein